ncbi:riboflavin-binding protein [Lingula anatina]|uniref:Riboflavin-binding protein n=1 Tax=Lingula anatina TaxID=7574 RepID=A0A1S3JP76_LINAN|nr:riboflavin-binding protein [Lingula anatina]|eukprot:XP_013412152.1 riboflavin-binding protein [Lingula anatina]
MAIDVKDFLKILVFIVFSSVVAIVGEDLVVETKKTCTYYGGTHVPSPENGLVNCSWYSTNACCKRTEVTSVFGGMYKLARASKKCQNRVNYLMCYFCSPEQHLWYQDQLHVCADFCDSIHFYCKTAMFSGEKIGTSYKNGKEICEGQKFKYVESNTNCFKFDPTVFDTGCSLKSSLITLLLVLGISIWIVH